MKINECMKLSPLFFDFYFDCGQRSLYRVCVFVYVFCVCVCVCVCACLRACVCVTHFAKQLAKRSLIT